MNPAASAAKRISNRAAAPPPIRLMIVDDSQVARAVLTRMVSAFPEFEVVATANDAGEALAALRNIEVDVIVLDLEMPGASGLEALPEIVSSARGAGVLIVSSFCDGRAEAAVRGLPAGAADTLSKPGSGNHVGRFSDLLAERLRRIGRRRFPSRAHAAKAIPPALKFRDFPDGKLACLAIGASTGGLHAVCALLESLPGTLGAPILITQHLPAAFLPFFSRQAETASGRPTRIVEEGMELAPDRLFLAPGDAHLSLEQKGSRVHVRLTTEAMPGGCMPSVDVMLAAAGDVYGRAAVGVVLSGMGRDGLAGSRRLISRGGAVLVQDRRSCAVWGMPKAVAEAGLASAVLPPAEISARIAERMEGARWK